MKIFVAYGYNERDRWIPELVFPIIKAFGHEVVTGEELQGEQITNAVISQIKRSDGLIAFLTRRGESANNGVWATHRWVTDELSVAIDSRRLVVEVRENGVDPQGGIAGDRQRIVYDEGKRDKCLVDIVTAIGRWNKNTHVKMQLLPEDISQKIRPFLQSPFLTCTYCLLVDNEESDEMPTRILPLPGGLFIQATNVPKEALIQVKIKFNGQSWSSNYISTDSYSIQLVQTN